MEKINEKLADNEFTPLIDAGIAKIYVLCSIINRKTEMCCMVRDSSHCNSFELDVYPNSASVTDGNAAPVKFTTHYGNSKFYPDSKYGLNKIDDCVSFLESCLKDRKIPYEMAYAVMIEVVKHYEI